MSEPTTVDWRAFFDAHAPHYMGNVFTRNTLAEVEFLLDVLKPPSGGAILDMGCGTGRHAVELARRGFRVTGVDLSEGMLEQAQKAALEAKVEVAWVHADATTYASASVFDAALCLCEGGFGLVNHDEDPIAHDLGILRSIHRALVPGGGFMLTALNGYAIIRRMSDENVAQGSFDPATMMAVYADQWNLPEGSRDVLIRERLFIPPEIVAMMRHVGFTVEHVWGGTAGDWGRRAVKLDEIEAMFVGRKA
jgi:2-polyprenyl-3-methyl-5-hydroxy-6-metoxy-1,4-benzoquinol methylase